MKYGRSSECYRTWTNTKRHVAPLRCCLVSFHLRHVQDFPSLELIDLLSFPFGNCFKPVQGFYGSAAPDNITANPKHLFLFTISAVCSEKQWSMVYHMWDSRWLHSRLCRHNILCIYVFCMRIIGIKPLEHLHNWHFSYVLGLRV